MEARTGAEAEMGIGTGTRLLESAVQPGMLALSRTWIFWKTNDDYDDTAGQNFDVFFSTRETRALTYEISPRNLNITYAVRLCYQGINTVFWSFHTPSAIHTSAYYQHRWTLNSILDRETRMASLAWFPF